MLSWSLPISLHRLHDDTSVGGDFQVQAVPVQQHHADETVYANSGSLDVSRLAVPDRSDAIHVEGSLATIGMDGLAVAHHR